MTRTRRTVLAAAVAVPLVGGAAFAVRQSSGVSQLRQAVQRFETRYDAALKALAAGPNVADALARADARALETALLPLRVAHQLDLVDIVAADGKIVTAFRAERFGIRAIEMVDKAAGSWPLTLAALKAPQPASSATSAAVIKTAWGEAIYRAIPVAQNGRVVGAILVGTPLQDALKL